MRHPCPRVPLTYFAAGADHHDGDWLSCTPVNEGAPARYLVRIGPAETVLLQLVRPSLSRAILTSLFILGVAVEMAGSVALSVLCYYLHYDRPLGGFTPNMAWALFAVASACTDCLVTGTLFVTLKRELNGLNRRKDSVAEFIINLALRTAAYTAICAVIGGVSQSSFPPDHR